MAFERSWGNERVVVALNLGGSEGEAPIDGVHGRVLLGTDPGAAGKRVRGRIELRAGAGVIVADDRPMTSREDEGSTVGALGPMG